MKFKLIHIVFVPILLIVSCGRKSLDKKEFFSWVDDEKNGLTIHHAEHNVDFAATFCPHDYIIAREMKVEEVNEENHKRRLTDLKGMEYFRIRLKRTDSNQEVLLYGLNNENEYVERVNYMSYGFDENLCLVRNNFKDTIYPALYHFERTYGVAPYADILVCFTEDTTLTDSNYKLLLNDNVFGNGMIIYDFDKKKLANAPKLKLY